MTAMAANMKPRDWKLTPDCGRTLKAENPNETAEQIMKIRQSDMGKDVDQLALVKPEQRGPVGLLVITPAPLVAKRSCYAGPRCRDKIRSGGATTHTTEAGGR